MRSAYTRTHSLRIWYDEYSRFSRLLAHILCAFCMVPFSQIFLVSHEVELGDARDTKEHSHPGMQLTFWPIIANFKLSQINGWK